jgi:class 3 adenylate cyclase
VSSPALTFLFSDIEGSTQRWERDAAAMADALRRHDDVVRAKLEVRETHARRHRAL